MCRFRRLALRISWTNDLSPRMIKRRGKGTREKDRRTLQRDEECWRGFCNIQETSTFFYGKKSERERERRGESWRGGQTQFPRHVFNTFAERVRRYRRRPPPAVYVIFYRREPEVLNYIIILETRQKKRTRPPYLEHERVTSIVWSFWNLSRFGAAVFGNGVFAWARRREKNK